MALGTHQKSHFVRLRSWKVITADFLISQGDVTARVAQWCAQHVNLRTPRHMCCCLLMSCYGCPAGGGEGKGALRKVPFAMQLSIRYVRALNLFRL